MLPTSIGLLASILAGLAGLGAVLAAIFGRNRDAASRFDAYTDRIEERLARVEAQLAEAKADADEARARLRGEQARASLLELRVSQLEAALLRAGMTIPPPYNLDGE